MINTNLETFLLIGFILVFTNASTTPTVTNTDKATPTNNVGTNATLPPLQDLLGMLGNLFNQNGTNAFPIPAGLSALLPGLGLPTAGGSLDNGTQLQTVIALAKTGLGFVLSNQGVGQKCQSDFFEFVDGVSSGEVWALQILDSFGKPERGFLQGDTNWLGNYQQCLDFYTTFENVFLDHINPTNFETKYCRVKMPLGTVLPEKIKSIGAEVTIGSCVSKSCSKSDVVGIITGMQTVASISKPISPSVECVEDVPMDTRAVVVIGILAVLGFLILIGTTFDVIAVQMHAGKNEDVHVNKETTPVISNENSGTNGIVLQSVASNQPPAYSANENGLDVNTGYSNGAYDGPNGSTQPHETPSNGFNNVSHQTKVDLAEVPKMTSATARPKERATLEKVILSFSAYTNGVKLLSANQAAGSLGAVNGIRFLSMCWVILGHTMVFAANFSNNYMLYGFTLANTRWSFIAIANATFSVDSFFTLSGLLVAYLSLRELKKVGGAAKLNWFMYYFHRFWRLTPAYMLVMMVGTVIYPLVIAGPMSSATAIVVGNCEKNWWINLLYVNNLVREPVNTCFGWAWYLANDMQFYVLSPLLLLPLFYNIYAGAASCLVFLSVTVGISAYVTDKYEYRPQYLSPFIPQPVDGEMFLNLYAPCYTRMGPYIIGAFTGYLLYKWECKCKINKMINVLIWLLVLCLSCTIVYSIYNEWDTHILTVSDSTAYQALSRTGWGVVVSWVVFACATGNGGWINELLSWKPFVPLGRLTYCAYLIHPILMYAYYETMPQQFHFTDNSLSYLFVGQLVFSYGGAFLTSLAFESPMMGLEKAIFKKK